MLSLKHITLTQFRNYESVSFDFPKRITAFAGKNGIGKTNVLDAIYYLCFTKSFSGRADVSSVKAGFTGFRIDGFWQQGNNEHRVICILRETGKKELWIDNEACTKFSKHIGRFPVVVISPDDIGLITGGGENRRRFLDTLLSQLSAEYLEQLIRYNKILQERNSLLKKMAEGMITDQALLEVLDAQLISYGNWIYSERSLFMRSFIPEVQAFYELIAGSREDIGINYSTALSQQSFAEVLEQNRSRDLALQRTNAGIHRDDLELLLSGQSFKTIASQGQRKSLLFALKLAEFQILKKKNGSPPLLLLDDIFEKLDEARMMNLLHWVCEENNGQVFLTDTHAHRIRGIMGEIKADYLLIELD